MLKTYSFLFHFLLLLFSSCFVHAQDGTLDSTFGTNGVYTPPVNHSGTDVWLRAIKPHPDGGFILGGEAENSSNVNDPFVMKIDAQGNLDSSFGNNGLVITQSTNSTDEYFRDMVILPDTSILVLAGYETHPTYGKKPFMYKLQPNGSPDSSFAPTQNGYWRPPNLNSYPDVILEKMLVLKSGQILLFGEYETSNNQDAGCIAFLSEDGNTFFTNYPNAWKRSAKSINIRDAAMGPDRSIYLALNLGIYDSAMAFKMIPSTYDPNNYEIDPKFGPNSPGLLTRNGVKQIFGTDLNDVGNVYSAIMGSDGYFYMAGFENTSGWTPNNTENGYVAMVSSDGQLSGDTVVKLNPSSFRDRIYDIEEVENNTFLMAGFTRPGSINKSALMRVKMDTATRTFSVDSSFGTDGRSTFNYQFLSQDQPTRLDQMLVGDDGSIYQIGFTTVSSTTQGLMIKYKNSLKPAQLYTDPEARMDNVIAKDPNGLVDIYFSIEGKTRGDSSSAIIRIEASTDEDFGNVAYTSTLADTNFLGSVSSRKSLSTSLNTSQEHFWRIMAESKTTGNVDTNELYFASHYYGDSLPHDSMKLWVKADMGVQDSTTSFFWDNMALGTYKPAGLFSFNSRMVGFEDDGTGIPSLQNNRVNGKPAVVFEKANQDYLKTQKNLDLTSGYTIFWVGRNRADSSFNGILRIDNGTSGYNSELEIYWGKSGQNGNNPVSGDLYAVTDRFYFGPPVNQPAFEKSAALDSTGPAPNRAFYSAMVGTQSDTAVELKLAKFNTPVRYIPERLTPADAWPDNAEVAYLGLGPGDVAPRNSFLDGEIAELIVYNRELSDAEKAEVQDYLDKKYFQKQVATKGFQDKTADALRVYPNPGRDWVVLEHEGAEDAMVRIFDMQGRLLKQVQMTGQRLHLNLEGLPAGLYSVQLASEQGLLHQRIVLE